MMLVFIPGKSLMCLSSRIGISLWGLFRVISYELMIAKDRDTGDCQMGSLHFRGCFSKNFRVQEVTTWKLLMAFQLKGE